MRDDQAVTNEKLNALIDGELSSAETAELLAAIKKDPQLKKRVAELRRVRDLVRYALDDTRVTKPRRTSELKTNIPYKTLAAGLILGLGLLLGWTLHGKIGAPSPMPGAEDIVSQNLFTVRPVQKPGAPSNEVKIILHITSGDPKKLDVALNKAETLMNQYRALNKRLILEILVNAGGLQLVRADTSPYRERIYAMQNRHANISFLACNITIKRLKWEKGIEAKLLPGVIVVPSALNQIVTRLQEGWGYIKT